MRAVRFPIQWLLATITLKQESSALSCLQATSNGKRKRRERSITSDDDELKSTANKKEHKNLETSDLKHRI